MTFRQIGTVALDGVSADLQVKYGWHTDTGAATNAPRSVAPQEKGEDPLRMTNWKNAEAEAPASVDREIIEQRAEARWATVSASLHRMRRDMMTVRSGAAPHGSSVIISMCIRTVHASPPTIARTRSAAVTSRKPATK